MINPDIFDMAAAVRATGLAEGEAALELADNLLSLLHSPTLQLQAEAALERHAFNAWADTYEANLESTKVVDANEPVLRLLISQTAVLWRDLTALPAILAPQAG